jgi:DNA repair protein RadC
MLVKLKPEILTEKLNQSIQVFELVKKVYDTFDYIDKDKEIFIVLGLHRNNKVKFIDCVSIGTLSATLVYPREVFRRAIKEGASTIILIHNHPSGELIPSNEDDRITKLLQEASKIIGIAILDHLIFGSTGTGYYSYADEGRMIMP